VNQPHDERTKRARYRIAVVPVVGALAALFLGLSAHVAPADGERARKPATLPAGKPAGQAGEEPAALPARRPGLAACHRAFLDAVKSGEPGPVRSTFADAVRTLEAALAANESAQTGKVISL
jgi:predicted dehydrogenase